MWHHRQYPCRKAQGLRRFSAKTGTTNDNYDKWLCGFTTYYTAVTWYGYDQNETVSYKGKSPAVQIWSAVMKNVHSNLSKTTFSMPGSIKQAKICAKTGMTATSKCEDVYTEYFLSGTVPSECIGCTGSNNKKKENTTKNNTTKNTTSNSSSENNVVRNTTEENTTTENISVNSTKNNTKNKKQKIIGNGKRGRFSFPIFWKKVPIGCQWGRFFLTHIVVNI